MTMIVEADVARQVRDQLLADAVEPMRRLGIALVKAVGSGAMTTQEAVRMLEESSPRKG